jgi:hypothetical protein
MLGGRVDGPGDGPCGELHACGFLLVRALLTGGD